MDTHKYTWIIMIITVIQTRQKKEYQQFCQEIVRFSCLVNENIKKPCYIWLEKLIKLEGGFIRSKLLTLSWFRKENRFFKEHSCRDYKLTELIMCLIIELLTDLQSPLCNHTRICFNILLERESLLWPT